MKVFITGGSGTLGRAIVRYVLEKEIEWDITIFSRDPVRHHAMRREFPDANLRFVIGDVLEYWTLRNAMAGHDIVIHAAAMKHIPEGEINPSMMYEINVGGSRNVAQAAFETNVHKVIGISTDKACHPVNVYGCTKMMMERMYMEYNQAGIVDFHLVRYGNVFGSTGSFISNWMRSVAEDDKIYSTYPGMTRFWFSDMDAAQLVIEALNDIPGTITTPLLPALGLDEIAHYLFPHVEIVYTGMRPGEKIHEELITEEEARFAEYIIENAMVRINPTTSTPLNKIEGNYSSDEPVELISEERLIELTGWDNDELG